jgi:hypothetical protein
VDELVAFLAGPLSLVGVLVGAWLVRGRGIEPPYAPPIANTMPPTTTEAGTHPEG